MLLFLFPCLLLLQSCVCSQYDDSEFSPAFAMKKLKNKHLVMVGDSLMRYQYLALVFSLKFDVKLTDSPKQNIVREATWSNWTEYYSATNGLMRPQEYCDCYRSPQFNYDQMFENRFYEDKEKNIKITFLLLNGMFNHGHWSNSSDSDELRLPQSVYTPSVWKSDFPETLTGFLQQMVNNNNNNNSNNSDDDKNKNNNNDNKNNKKSNNDSSNKNKNNSKNNNSTKSNKRNSVLVMNAGHHVHHFKEEEYSRVVASRAVALFGQAIWKTTSYVMPSMRKGYKKGEKTHPHDYVMCSMAGIKCFNISWVQDVKEEYYSDFLHFLAPVYNVINARMMNEIDDSK